MAKNRIIKEILVYISVATLVLFYVSISKENSAFYDYKKDTFFVFPILSLFAIFCLYAFYFDRYNKDTPVRVKAFDLVGIVATLVIVISLIINLISNSKILITILCAHGVIILMSACKNIKALRSRQ